MRIGIDARFYGPESKGLGRYTQKLITYLESIDNENDYVIFLRKSNYDLYEPKNPRFVKVCADYQWYSLSEQALFPFVLYKYKCDLIHFLHFNVPLLYKKKYIVTIHDLILLHYPTRKASTHDPIFYWFKYLMYRIIIANALYFAKHIVAVSEFTKNDICQKYKRVCNKISVVYEAAEVTREKRSMNRSTSLSSYGIIGPYILYVGNAYPHKNLLSLVDAFKLTQSMSTEIQHLVLVGKRDYFYKQIATHVATHNVENVIIVATITDADLEVLYKNAHIFAFPSLYEGFGLPPLEAQLYGVPVVSSDHTCMREVLSDNGALYCDTRDAQKFAQALDTIISDQKIAKRLVHAGIVNVQRYSWKKMAQEISNIYKKIL